MLEIFKNPIYRILWLSLVFSVTSGNIGYLVIYDIMNQVYNQIIAVSYYNLIYDIIPIIFTYLITVIVDKYDQRYISLLSSIARTVISIGYIFAYKYNLAWVFFVTVALKSLMISLFRPAFSAYVSKVINKDMLIHANTVDSITISILSICMQGIGGILLKYINLDIILWTIIGLYILTDFISSSLIWYKRFDDIYKNSEGTLSMKKNKEKSQITMFRESIQYLQNNASIFNLIIIKSLGNLALGCAIATSYYYGFYKLTIQNSGPLTMGIAGVITALFAIVWSILANKYVKNDINKMVFVCFLGTVGMFMGMIGFTLSFNIFIWILGESLLYAGNNVLYDMLTTIIQKKVPDDIQGRVSSIGYNIRTFFSGLGVIISGIVFTYYKDFIIHCLIIFTAVMLLTTIYAYYVFRTFKIHNGQILELYSDDSDGIITNLLSNDSDSISCQDASHSGLSDLSDDSWVQPI